MRNLARLFANQGSVNWDVARQFAQWVASGGKAEDNVDPVARVRVEELLRIAELHVADATGLSVSSTGMLSARCVTPSQWAVLTLEAWKDLIESLGEAMAGTLGDQPAEGEEAFSPDNPMAQMLGNLPQMLGPFLFGMQAGSMVGHLAERAMGSYDLPMPRPAGDQLLFVPPTIDGFASAWSLSPDDVRMWVCLREVTNHAVLGRPHVRARLDELIGDYVGAFEPDPSVVEDRLAGIDPTDMAAMQRMFADPTTLLGEMQSDTQRRLQVPLRALLSVVTGYVDHVMEGVGRRLVGNFGPLTEALHRRRLEEDSGSKVLGRLFGVELTAGDYERGQAFVAGVVERAGDDGLGRLWRSARELPTPAEVDAPGLWLARIELDLPE